MKIVLDSDVIVVGLISSKGAGFCLLRRFPDRKIQVYTAKKQINEINKVLVRSSFNWTINKNLWQNWQKKVEKIALEKNNKLQSYLNDPNDSHILALAKKTKANFILTYNLKDYKKDKIKDKFNILVVSPGYFLQYLRSLNI